MAKVIPSNGIDSFSGRFSRKDRIVLRTRYGRTHAYTIEHPYTGPASEGQNANRSAFGEASRQASLILKDPDQRAQWEKLYRSYLRRRRPSEALAALFGNASPVKKNAHYTLRGFIISTLTAQLKTTEQPL